jgi:hypothetical protein
MDGPYEMNLTGAGASTATLECRRRGASSIVLGVFEIDPEQFRREARAVASQVRQACIARNWRSVDVDNLKALLNDF